MCPFDAELLYHSMLDKIRATYHNEIAFVGIWSGGAWLAQRLASDLGAPAFGVLSISLHRDDYAEKGLNINSKSKSKLCSTSLPFDVNGRRIILVDDVLYTGRTIRAALNELYDFGRPATVELAVLADRGGRELPIAARFVGATVNVPPDQTLVLKRDDRGQWAFSLALEPVCQSAT